MFFNLVRTFFNYFEGPKKNVNNRNQSEEIEFFTQLVYENSSRYVVEFRGLKTLISVSTKIVFQSSQGLNKLISGSKEESQH